MVVRTRITMRVALADDISESNTLGPYLRKCLEEKGRGGKKAADIVKTE